MPDRLARRVRREWEARPSGQTTHVVTVSAAQERFLDDALFSVRSQTYRDKGELVVRWGPGTEHATLADARNHGLATAPGRFARLLQAGDTVPWHSTAVLVRAVVHSKQGTAAGRAVESSPSWRDRAFPRPSGSDDGLADRLVDLERWRSSGVGFDPTHGRFGDATVAATDRVLGCAHVDEVTHEDHGRALGLPFGHLPRWSSEVDAWCAAVGHVEDPRVAAVVLDRRLPGVLGDVESFSDDQWRRVCGVARALWSRADVWSVRAESRVLAWLAGEEDREQVTRLVLDRWRSAEDFPTEVHGAEVFAAFTGIDAPAEVRRLTEAETPLVLIPQSRTRKRLDLVAFVRGVATSSVPDVRARYAERGVQVVVESTPTATGVAAEAEHNHDYGWLVIDLDDAPLRATLEVELTSQGVTRTAQLDVPGSLVATAPSDPRGEDEIGPFAQTRLQRWYAEDSAFGPIEPDLAYFQSYTGQHATDGPLAVHCALRALRPEIRTRWLVEDPSVPLPEGAEPVLLRSRDWYHTLATAHWVVTNIDPERWFQRLPGQELLQTFHGAPSKTMGIGLWEQMGLTPGRIEQSLAHGSRNWTLLVSACPELSGYYREQFDYDGPICEQGDPRDDVLLRPEAAQIRDRVRAQLGIAPEQTAVLYAPTWRDDLAIDYRRAERDAGFDPARAAAALGPSYVVLARGHRFHREPVAAQGVLDVTTYPEVNDLILAADAAVLDYSSLRFDFALTGRPMVFCVPDLQAYADQRGFLYDYRASAPGPITSTTEQVVDALGDLPALVDGYAEARRLFHERFNALQDGHAAERVARAFFGA